MAIIRLSIGVCALVLSCTAIGDEAKESHSNATHRSHDSAVLVIDGSGIASISTPQVIDGSGIANNAAPRVIDGSGIANLASPQIIDGSGIANINHLQVIDGSGLQVRLGRKIKLETISVDSTGLAPDYQKEEKKVAKTLMTPLPVTTAQHTDMHRPEVGVTPPSVLQQSRVIPSAARPLAKN